jgi:hypothetical protein
MTSCLADVCCFGSRGFGGGVNLVSFAEQLPDHLFYRHFLDVDVANVTRFE